MAEVLKFKQRPVKGTQPPVNQEPTGNRYFCRRCDCQEFLIMETGSVHCSSCYSLIRNLEVRE
jgi:late competence protein required for DNA uptake (superfamily II DNA/RNA helicase)